VSPNYKTVTSFFIGISGDLDYIMALKSLDSGIEFQTVDFKSIRIPLAIEDLSEISMNIKNVGVFDRSTTLQSGCDSEIETISKNFPRTCQKNQYLNSIYKLCRCVPFTYLESFRKLHPNSSTTLCTTEDYVGCVGDMIKAAKKFRPCAPSCVTIKNEYSLMTSYDNDAENLGVLRRNMTHPELMNDRITYFRTMVILRCIETSYAIYEEKYQATFQQLVSQIGGALGLYTGLSILSVWKFLVLLFELAMRRRRAIDFPRTQISAIDGRSTTHPEQTSTNNPDLKSMQNETVWKRNIEAEMQLLKHSCSSTEMMMQKMMDKLLFIEKRLERDHEVERSEVLNSD
jgi:hypothetical protein